MLEPGKAAKTDKSSIITDAIRVVTQLRAENGQLRQLNKFLEVGGALSKLASDSFTCTFWGHLRQGCFPEKNTTSCFRPCALPFTCIAVWQRVDMHLWRTGAN